jgi:hypothetical protein
MLRALKFALYSAATCAVCAAASCDGDGVTSNCPPLPLYQNYPLGDASVPDAANRDSAATNQALATAVSAGCATAPSRGASASGSADNVGAAGSN